MVAHDARRDAFLRSAGYAVLRIGNREVVSSPDGVWALIDDALRNLTPTPNPSPQGGGEQDLRRNFSC